MPAQLYFTREVLRRYAAPPDSFSGLGRRRDGALFANRSANTGFERMAAQLHETHARHLDMLLPNKRGALRIVPACVVGMVILCAARSLRGAP
jgi:hypothetical protein